MPDALDVDLAGAVARGWCTPENAHKVMDPDLALAIVAEVRKHLETTLSWSGLFELGVEQVDVAPKA